MLWPAGDGSDVRCSGLFCALVVMFYMCHVVLTHLDLFLFLTLIFIRTERVAVHAVLLLYEHDKINVNDGLERSQPQLVKHRPATAPPLRLSAVCHAMASATCIVEDT